MEAVIRKGLQTKNNVIFFVFTAFIIVLSIEVFLYFFLKQAQELNTTFGTTSTYVYTIINPLIELGRKIYIPSIIETLGIVNTLIITFFSTGAYLVYIIKYLFDQHKPYEPSGMIILRAASYHSYDERR